MSGDGSPVSRHDEARAGLCEAYELLASIGRRTKAERSATGAKAPDAVGDTSAHRRSSRCVQMAADETTTASESPPDPGHKEAAPLPGAASDGAEN